MPQKPKTFRMVYMDFSSARLEEDLRFYSEIMGLRQDGQATADRTWLSLGFDHHNLSFRKGDNSGLEAVGYQLAADIDLDSMAKHLDAAGLAYTRKSDARPGVDELIEVEPIGGHSVHLISAISQTEGTMTTTGVAPLRLGHFAVASAEGAAIKRFYTEVLGFHRTDAFGDVLDFYTCNYEHHVLNVVEAPTAHRLHHLAFQLRETGSHVNAADLLARDSKPIVWGPTRHTAGHNIASYFQDDSKRLVELYTEMDVYLPDLDMMEPRPWHEEIPMRPRRWERGDVAHWRTKFAVELSQF
ncbi:VOC family protein [Rhizobium sp. L1K21]|uniref:VOC family protein n=1 Tax=Rhizobium sp. L1K21 TaxID=2954933 RepID=UPI002092E7A2|nr:VOC family protein [Rhizobium sp. L1K21]MCO6188419.1 VOC family protein [Rhizobium sp. L1K21]